MRLLVAYGSKHHATEEIASAIAEEIERHGIAADCLAAETVSDLDSYDAVVLGSAVYFGRWHKAARRLLKRHASELATKPLWLFSSGPFGKQESGRATAEPPGLARRAKALGARDHVAFGGRVPLDPANPIERSILKNTPAEGQDRRDWAEIRRWAAGIAEALTADAAPIT
jgi:menaquinone-dependent protoporphyrinogen oxidase